MDKAEKRRIYYTLFFPVLICLFIVLVFFFERGMGWDFHIAGLFPRDLKTLPNVFTMPFIHSDLSHLLNNIISFFVLSSCLYYFYSQIANKILLLSVVFSGLILFMLRSVLVWHISLGLLLLMAGMFSPLPVLVLLLVVSAYRDWETDRKSTRLNSSHITRSRMPSSA